MGEQKLYKLIYWPRLNSALRTEVEIWVDKEASEDNHLFDRMVHERFGEDVLYSAWNEEDANRVR
jgi:hypothetical protein